MFFFTGFNNTAVISSIIASDPLTFVIQELLLSVLFQKYII